MSPLAPLAPCLLSAVPPFPLGTIPVSIVPLGIAPLSSAAALAPYGSAARRPPLGIPSLPLGLTVVRPRPLPCGHVVKPRAASTNCVNQYT